MNLARRPNVLLVDDEPLVRAAASNLLRDEGCDVFEASAAEPAFALLVEHPEIDVLFTDLNMPGMDGLDLACRVRRTHPNLHVILTSGQWEHTGEQAPDGAVFLQKPYSIDSLAQLIKALVKAAT